MKLTFPTAITVGDLQNQISLTSLDVTQIAFQTVNPNPGDVAIWLTLRDPVTGWQTVLHYVDSTLTAAFWTEVCALVISGKPWMQYVLERAMADKQIPQGVVSPT
jgi:hypothetical protein